MFKHGFRAEYYEANSHSLLPMSTHRGFAKPLRFMIGLAVVLGLTWSFVHSSRAIPFPNPPTAVSVAPGISNLINEINASNVTNVIVQIQLDGTGTGGSVNVTLTDTVHNANGFTTVLANAFNAVVNVNAITLSDGPISLIASYTNNSFITSAPANGSATKSTAPPASEGATSQRSQRMREDEARQQEEYEGLIPPDFFQPGSEPFTGNIPLGGGNTSSGDTVVQRQGGSPNPPPTVPIEITDLSLHSTNPIVIGLRQFVPQDVIGNPLEESILRLYGIGVLNPLKIEFRPDDHLSRVELLKVVLLAFGIHPDPTRALSPFSDVDHGSWYGPLVDEAYARGIMKGYGDGEARPGQFVTKGEARLILERASHLNRDLFKLSKADTSHDDELITRGEMAQMTVSTHDELTDAPCDCDAEKAAWEDAEKAAKAAQDAADKAASDAKTANDAADQAAKDSKAAQDKVDELSKFFDDSSSVTGPDGEKITTGDLELLREVNRGVYNDWKSGKTSAADASKAWGANNKDKLNELRAKKKAELDAAKKAADDAKAKADKAKKDAADAAAKAKDAQKKADDAKAKADAAKAAYDDCLKKCKLLMEEQAAKRAQEEAAAAAAAAAKKQQEDDARRAAETKAQQEAAAKKLGGATSAGGGGGRSTTSGGGGGDTVAKPGPCQQKFSEAVKARAQQILDARGTAPEAPPPGQTAADLAGAVGDAIGGAAAAIAEGGGNAAAGLAAGWSGITFAYGLWVNYVGNAIQAAGERIIVNRRICEYVSVTTDDGCGHVTFTGQTVYYERSPDGKLHVLVMGPGDKVVAGECAG